MKEFWKELLADRRYLAICAIFFVLFAFFMDMERWFYRVSHNYGITIGLIFLVILVAAFLWAGRRFSRASEDMKVLSEKDGD